MAILNVCSFIRNGYIPVCRLVFVGLYLLDAFLFSLCCATGVNRGIPAKQLISWIGNNESFWENVITT